MFVISIVSLKDTVTLISSGVFENILQSEFNFWVLKEKRND
jgi:hypothetical protein